MHGPETSAAPAFPARWGLPLLLLVTALAYAALWPAGFSWDDEALVVDNQLTGQAGAWRALLTTDLWASTRLQGVQSGYYRPLFLLSLALDRRLFGLDASWAHLHGLLWHLLATGALYALLRRLTGPVGPAPIHQTPEGGGPARRGWSRRAKPEGPTSTSGPWGEPGGVPPWTTPALAGAALFALHPVQSEVLALVAARNDAMAAAFTLLALVAVAAPAERRPTHLAAAFAATLAGLLSKESGVLAPVILLALDLGRGGLPALRQGWPRYLPLAAAVAAYALVRSLVGVNAGIVPGQGSWATVAAHLPQVAATYARLLVWPWPLSPARHLAYLDPLAHNLPALLVLVGLLAFAIARGARRGLVLAGLAWALLAWLPTLAATLDKGLLGERYLYLPLAGLALSLAAALPRLPRWLLPAFALPAVLALQLRLPDWQDSRSVWAAAHRDAPTPYTAAGLGWYLHRDGELDAAVPLLIQAVEGDPPYTDACALVLQAMLQARRDEEAARLGQRLLDEGRCPAEGPLPHHLALALAGTGQWDRAAALARPRPTGTSLVVLGADLARRGDLAGLAALARQQPDPPGYVRQVGKLLRLGDAPQAAEAALSLLSPTSEAQ